MVKHDVKDIDLAKKGMLRIEWAAQEMPVLKSISERFRKEKPLKGVRIAACLHVTTETAALMETLKAGGAELTLCASNPLSTQDDAAASLVKHLGISVFAIKGEDRKTYYRHIEDALSFKPQITLDDGADLVSTLHKESRGLLPNVIGGTEETTTGVIRLRAMAKDGALPTTAYHGYHAIDYYAVDEHLGDAAELSRLVDGAHALGISIILDMVANHTSAFHPWVGDPPTPTWYNGTAERHLANTWQTWTLADPYSPAPMRQTTLDGWFIDILPDLNQDDEEARRYLVQNTLWWLGVSGLHGIRQDTLPDVPRSFWRDWTAVIKREYPRVRVVGEMFDGTGCVEAFRRREAEEFSKVTKVTGLIITKLDGTAKGGTIFQICESHKTPVKYIGVGEKLDDLQTFNPQLFVDALFRNNQSD